MQFGRGTSPARVGGQKRGGSGPAREGGGHGVGVALLIVTTEPVGDLDVLQGFDPFAYHLHAEPLQVLHQAGQHAQGMGRLAGLQQQGAIQLDDLVGQRQHTLEVALQGTEVIAGDMGTVAAQYLDQRPVLPLQGGLLQHFEPDLDPQLARLHQHQQQQVLIGGAVQGRVEINGKKIGSAFCQGRQIPHDGPEHDDVQMQGLLLTEGGKVDALIALLGRLPASGQYLITLDLMISADDRLIEGHGKIGHRDACHVTDWVLFLKCKHGTHLLTDRVADNTAEEIGKACRNRLIIDVN